MNYTVAVVVLALVAGAILVVKQQNYVPGQTDISSNGRDAYVEAMSLRVMDGNGMPVYKMTAGHMTHYAGSDHIELDKPLVYITRPDGSVWHASAERGESDADGGRIWLRGAVDMQRLADSTHGPIRITTSELLVKPAEKLAETDSRVLIITDSYHLEAIGLNADFNTSRLDLRSRVRGRIDGAG